MSKKKEWVGLDNITFFCPNLKRNVRFSLDDFYWDTEIEYGENVLYAHIMCRCGNEHKIQVASLPNPCNDCSLSRYSQEE